MSEQMPQASENAPPPTDVQPSQPAPGTQPAYEPVSAGPVEQPKKRSGCRSCALGCLITLGVFVLVLVFAAGWFFNWPAQWGLVASPAESVFEPGVNPYASDDLEAELAAQGLNMQGVSVFVVATEDGSGHVAYILVDDQNGADWSHDTYRSAAEGFLILSAGTQAADTYAISRIAVDHRDEQGTQAAVMTAPTTALREYAAGAITQQELFDQMDGYADMAGMLAGASSE